MNTLWFACLSLLLAAALLNLCSYRLTQALRSLPHASASRWVPWLTLAFALCPVLPDWLTALWALSANHESLAMGTLIGGNLARIGLVLPLVTTAQPLLFNKNIITRDIPLLMIVSVMFLVLALDNHFARMDGLVLLTLFGIYALITFKRKGLPENIPENALAPVAPLRIALYCVGLALGAFLLASQSAVIALRTGIHASWLGLGILATALRGAEVSTALGAARKGQMADAVGTLIQSSTLTVLFSIGSLALLRPLRVPLFALTGPSWDIWVMLISSFVLLMLVGFNAPRSLNRPKAMILLLLFGSYLWWRLYS